MVNVGTYSTHGSYGHKHAGFQREKLEHDHLVGEFSHQKMVIFRNYVRLQERRDVGT